MGPWRRTRAANAVSSRRLIKRSSSWPSVRLVGPRPAAKWRMERIRGGAFAVDMSLALRVRPDLYELLPVHGRALSRFSAVCRSAYPHGRSGGMQEQPGEIVKVAKKGSAVSVRGDAEHA